MIFQMQRRRWMKLGVIFLGGLALLAPGLRGAETDGEKAYDSFVSLVKSNTVGVILAEIRFGQDGNAKQCRIIRSNAPYSLEASTTEYIELHWKLPLFAGETRFFPITFDQLPSYVPHWNDEMVAPPDPLAVGDPQRKLKLRLSFGADGWIKKVEVADPSGLDSLDRQTGVWVQVHWHHDAYANQVIDAPFQFEPPPAPPAPPPPVVKKTKPVEPAQPTEPMAIPAMRVQ
jgi:hypothetical protein